MLQDIISRALLPLAAVARQNDNRHTVTADTIAVVADILIVIVIVIVIVILTVILVDTGGQVPMQKNQTAFHASDISCCMSQHLNISGHMQLPRYSHIYQEHLCMA